MAHGSNTCFIGTWSQAHRHAWRAARPSWLLWTGAKVTARGTIQWLIAGYLGCHGCDSCARSRTWRRSAMRRIVCLD